MASKLITLSYFDTTNNIKVRDIKASITKYPKNPDLMSETESQEELVIDSFDDNKAFDFQSLRKDKKGKTYFSPQVGSIITLKSLKNEVQDWNAIPSINQITLTIY